MNFSVLPPEVNSARMFTGAGLAPMLDAAAAWDGLAGELSSAASSFGSVTLGLADGWQGPAAAAMAAAATPYAGRLSQTAANAATTASQARAAAAVFEAARAATVHPGQVAANRTQLLGLVNSNLFGLNAPAIAAVETEYEQMWAQDVAAMAGYHAAASAALAQVPVWQQALQGLSGLKNALAAVSLSGLGNLGIANIGIANIGNANLGIANIGNFNVGIGNATDIPLIASYLPSWVGFNVGLGNTGYANLGSSNWGGLNIGLSNYGVLNVGFSNLGVLSVGIGNDGPTTLVSETSTPAASASTATGVSPA